MLPPGVRCRAAAVTVLCCAVCGADAAGGHDSPPGVRAACEMRRVHCDARSAGRRAVLTYYQGRPLLTQQWMRAGDRLVNALAPIAVQVHAQLGYIFATMRPQCGKYETDDMGAKTTIFIIIVILCLLGVVGAGAETHWFGLQTTTLRPTTVMPTLAPTTLAATTMAAPITLAPTVAATTMAATTTPPAEPGPVVVIPGNNGSISCSGYCNGGWGINLIPAASYPQYSGATSTQTLPSGATGNCPCTLTNTQKFVPW